MANSMSSWLDHELPKWYSMKMFCFVFEMGSHCIAQAGHYLMILLSQLHKFWGYWQAHHIQFTQTCWRRLAWMLRKLKQIALTVARQNPPNQWMDKESKRTWLPQTKENSSKTDSLWTGTSVFPAFTIELKCQLFLGFRPADLQTGAMPSTLQSLQLLDNGTWRFYNHLSNFLSY